MFGSRKVLPEKELAEKLQNMTPQQWRDMQIGGQLNKVLTANEKLGKSRNDAKATAEGIQIIANWNTKNGKLNVQGFRNDLGKFFIDQTFEHAKEPVTWTIGLASKTLHGVGESPLASKLFGYNRSQSHGWNAKYVEFNNLNANQAHHFAAFVIAGIDKGEGFARWEAEVLDAPYLGNNPPDIALGYKGATVGESIRTSRVNTSNIKTTVYNAITKP